MCLILPCSSYEALHFPPHLTTDICAVSAFKWKATALAALLLLSLILHLLRKFRFRCQRTMLTFHNLRAAVSLLLLAINSLDVAHAFLSSSAASSSSADTACGDNECGRGGAGNGNGCHGNGYNFTNPDGNTQHQQQQQQPPPGQDATDFIVVVVGAATLRNALAATLLTGVLMWYHRVVELKKCVAYLNVSSGVLAVVFLLRIYEIAEIVYDHSLLELEPCLQSASAACLLALAIIDGCTIYKERYRLDYNEDHEKIGYKHTLATFYSKACFWWLVPLLWFGYREPLELHDLGQMRVEDTARAHYDRFLLIYKTAKVKNADRAPSLWLCYAKSSWRMFALGGVLKLFGDLFALIGPLAIQQIVQYIESMYALRGGVAPPPATAAGAGGDTSTGRGGISSRRISGTGADTDADVLRYGGGGGGTELKIYYPGWLDLVSNGWTVAWIVLLAALAQGALSQGSTHILNMTGIRIKTSLQGLIYRKTLLLNASCIDSAESGEAGATECSETAEDGEDAVELRAGRRRAGGGRTEEGAHSDNDTSPPIDSEAEGGLNDVGSITNLMSEDTLNVMSFFWIAHYIWAIPLKIAVVMYLLYLKLGISAVIGSFVCILTMTPLQFLIGKAMSSNAESVAKFTDERLRKLHDTVIGIKLIKLNAWDDVFIRRILDSREKELKHLNKDSLYWTLMTILTHISSVLITFVTLAVYVTIESDAGAAEFTASRLFSALALFQQLTVPLLIFPITVPIIIAAVVSTQRLERFLQSREIQKQFEGIRHMARILCKSDASLDMYEVPREGIVGDVHRRRESNDRGHDEATKENTLNECRALRLQIPDSPAPLAQAEPQTPLAEHINGGDAVPHEEKGSAPPVFPAPPMIAAPTIFPAPLDALPKSWEEKKLSIQRKELLRNSPYVVTRPRRAAADFHGGPSLARRYDSLHRDSLQLKTCPEDMAVSVRNGCFGWQPNRLVNALNVGSVNIPKGRLTVIVGKSGSGKSSLLAALLLEMPLISGDMIWNKTCTIAFVPQQPWLLNASIRENILFGESYRPKRYDFVLDACALKPDIELMPDADCTVIGERGINLSGGQRQRVAIARALYSSANVVIMDDPLSSLDNAVARHIFEQSIRRMLLQAHRTVILVTQQLQLAQQADYLIVMKDGHLQASGTYKDIEARHPRIIAKWNAKIAQSNARDEYSDDGDGGAALGRTARERWKLFRNVTKLSLQRSASASAATSPPCFGGDGGGGGGVGAASGDGRAADDGDGVNFDAATSAENDDVLPASMLIGSSHALHGSQSLGSFSLTRKRSSYYGSRHLLYDVPLPIDECQTEEVVFRRRQRRSGRPGSRASSRLSGASSTASTELRRSVLTASCSSATSYASYASNTSGGSTAGGEAMTLPAARVLSWQPQSATAAAKSQQLQSPHQPVARNASSPGSFARAERGGAAGAGEEGVGGELADGSDAALVADLVKSAKPDGGFQQFLRRMSMRRANKPTAVTVLHRKHRPVSATNSILSISEESTGLPAVELGATKTMMETATETDSWIANIEDEESAQDSDMDYKARPSANNASDMAAPPPAAPGASSAIAAAAAAIDVERKYGKIPAQIYLLYLRASGAAIVLIFFGSALIWQCLRVYTDVWLQHWTDDGRAGNAAASPPHRQYQHDEYHPQAGEYHNHPQAVAVAEQEAGHHQRVTHYFRVYAAISCVCVLMAALSTPAGQLAGCNARRRLHEQLLRSIMRKSLHFFQVTPLGRIINRFSNDMAVIDKKIAATSQRLLQFTLLCLCAVLINVGITPWFIVVTLPICAAYYAIQKFYRCSSRELQRIDNATNTPVISHLSETIQGVATIRAYSQEARFTEMLFRRLEANTIAFTILNTSNRWLGISLDYLGGVIVFVAIVTALLAATISSRRSESASEPSPSPSLVGLAINYTLLIPIYLNWVVKLLADMEMYVGSVERIAYYAETETEPETETEAAGDNGVEMETAAAVTPKDDGATTMVRHHGDRKRYKSVPISWPQRGDIAFENVSLRYEGQHEEVIRNLTLSIPSGQRIGICGRTGSGKSSLALSLFGVLQTTGGRIRIDDVDITQIHPDEIRSRLSIIPQDVHLFSGTIRENLDPPGYYSDLALWNCLELAQLKEFVNGQLPHGLDTEIAEGGRNFSSGHRQLLCLARAILRGSVCLVLDEATSSLDTSTEAALLAAAHKAFHGRTILTIAHRLSTILDYDRIVVLDGGRIVEDGSPRQLAQRADGAFSALLHSGRPLSTPSDADCTHSIPAKEANRS